MTVTDTWADWTTDASTDSPPGTATPEIDDEIRNIKAQVKANVVPGRWTADDAGLTTLISDIGSDLAEVVLDSSITINPTASTYTIPANITLKLIKPGTYAVADGKTLEIAGPIEAGPYQIFSWTGSGAIDISGSPTSECPLQWWGAASGTGNDISTALVKANASTGTGNHQAIRITKGVWRIATPTVLTKTNNYSSIRLIGDSIWDSQIYIDVGGSDVGLTIGDDAITNDWFYCDKLTFIGPATCCTNALKIVNVEQVRLPEINFWCGSTDYALDIQGCLWLKGIVKVGARTASYGSYARPAKGIKAEEITADQVNVLDLEVFITGGGVMTDGLYLLGTTSGNLVQKITGSIEGVTSKVINATKIYHLDISDFYGEDGNTGSYLFTDCGKVSVQNIYASDVDARFSGCKNVTIDTFAFDTLTIDPDCQFVRLGTGTVSTALVDQAPSTVYAGQVNLINGSDNPAIASPKGSAQNILNNALLNRWSATAPDGWSITAGAGTYTLCGTGESDTTNHNTPYCALLQTNGAAADNFYALTAAQIKQMAGNYATFSVWLKPSSVGGTKHFTTYPNIQIGIATPVRGDSTDYVLGDAVTVGGITDKQFVCVVAGQSDSSAPTFVETVYGKTTDGGVTWMALPYSYTNTYLTSVNMDVWTQLKGTIYVGNNATALSVGMHLTRYSDNSNSKLYYSEPCLMIGSQDPAGVVPGAGEFNDHIQVAANRMDWDGYIPTNSSSKLYGLFSKQGDIVWNTGAAHSGSPGWICTGSGVNGSTSAWYAFTNTIA